MYTLRYTHREAYHPRYTLWYTHREAKRPLRTLRTVIKRQRGLSGP